MNNMATDGKKIFWLSFGVLTGVGVSLCVSELRRRIRENSARHSLAEIQNAITLEDLATLARSTNISLKRSAEQVILERAMKDENLEFILNACSTKSDEVQVLKGVSVVGILVKSSDFRGKLIAFNAIEILAQCLDYSIAPGFKKLELTGGRHVKIQGVIVSSMLDLVCDEDRLKKRLVNATPSFISSVFHLMMESRSREIVRWSIFLIHQLSLCDAVRPRLVDDNAISIMAQIFVRNQGDNVLMRICLQTLVMCANNDDEGEIHALHEIARHNVIRPAIGALKSDDSDLVYWATALIHEYSVKDLYKAQIIAAPNLIKTLQSVLSTSEAVLQRIILRVISFLCLGDQFFRSRVLSSDSILKKLIICFASGDSDVVHWAVVLFHDLLLSSGSSGSASKELAERIIKVSENTIKCLVALTDRKDNSLIRVVAEILAFFASVDYPSETLQKHLIKDGALEAVIKFLQSPDTELQLWSSALLLNLCMTSDSVKEEIIRLGGVKSLIELAIIESDQHPVAAQSAKALVMLGFVEKTVPIKFEHTDSISRISFDENEYTFEQKGIHICVLDFLAFKIIDIMSFDGEIDSSMFGKVVEGIDGTPYGCLVLILCSGMDNTLITHEASEALKEIGLCKTDLKSDAPWAFMGRKKTEAGEQIAILSIDSNEVHLSVQISLGRNVNELVLTNLLLPIIEMMMSSPPSSAISKVSELELLTIMARHDDHKQVMVKHKGFLHYLAELCWNISSNSASFLHEHPMFIAHCIGALKIISSISISESFQEELLASGVIGTALSLLYFVNDLSLSKVNQATLEKLSTLPSQSVTQSQQLEAETNFGKSKLLNQGLLSPTHIAHSFSAEDISFDERKLPLSPTQATCSRSTSSSTPEDFDDAFCTIVRLAVIIIYNCMGVFARVEDSCTSLIKSGTLQTLWCTLLTSNETSCAQIGLPIEVLLNCFATMAITEKGTIDNLVELDDSTKTAALILSADHLEVYNMNWTFESIRATASIGRRNYEDSSSHPDGWYYEVKLKSNGILQIGWQTEACSYGPEKGFGVGDDYNSCAFDGARCKVWNGPASEHVDNDYGSEWQEGDILSCLFSWDGDVSFWINGIDKGIAFSKMDANFNWFPAASLAMDQHCVFNFGQKPFRYSPPNCYVPVAGCKMTNYKKRTFSSPHVSCWSTTTREPELNEGNMAFSTEQTCTVENDQQGQYSDLKEDITTQEITQTPKAPFTPTSYKVKSTNKHPSNIDILVNSEEPWMQFSPGESLTVESETPSFPCYYFEAELKNSPSDVKQVGFFCTETSKKIFCDLVDGKIFLPKASQSTPEDQESYLCPDVVGCGILWPTNMVFFTLDGVGTGKYYQFPTQSLNLNSLFPYISCTRISCNYGHKLFLFEGANFKEVSFAGANLLHNHGLSREITCRLSYDN